MYHYTECGLQKVYLENGYKVHKTPYGKGVSVQDVAGLHQLIGRTIAQRPRLTGAELRFLRKEMGLSQRKIADLLGTTEQNISLWERHGKIPRGSARFVKIIYLGHLDGDVHVQKILDAIAEQDDDPNDALRFRERAGEWKAAA